MIDTLTEIIHKFDIKHKKIDLSSVEVMSGKLEAILEESTSSEEICAFEIEGEEFMLVFRKPCIEYFDTNLQIAIWLYPK
jgi:hypothetical protein